MKLSRLSLAKTISSTTSRVNPLKPKLEETTYGKDGLRAVLLRKNQVAKAKVEALKKQYAGMYTGNAQKAEKEQGLV